MKALILAAALLTQLSPVSQDDPRMRPDNEVGFYYSGNNLEEAADRLYRLLSQLPGSAKLDSPTTVIWEHDGLTVWYGLIPNPEPRALDAVMISAPVTIDGFPTARSAQNAVLRTMNDLSGTATVLPLESGEGVILRSFMTFDNAFNSTQLIHHESLMFSFFVDALDASGF